MYGKPKLERTLIKAQNICYPTFEVWLINWPTQSVQIFMKIWEFATKLGAITKSTVSKNNRSDYNRARGH